MNRLLCFALIACFTCLAGLGSAALPIENCADVWRVSFNQQAIFSSNSFNPGSPSTIKIAGKPGNYFWFENGMNGSDQFDVVTAEERGYLNAGEIVFRQYGETLWFSKDSDGVVLYDCSLNGGGKTDEFHFYAGKGFSFKLANGKSFTADYLRVKANRKDAFRLRDDFLGDEFYVLASRVWQGASDYGAGSVFFASPSEAGKFEEYYAYAIGKQYARIPYVGCCAQRLATLAASATPTPAASPPPAATLEPTLEPTAAPTARPTAPSPAPTPILEKPARDFNLQTNGLLTAIVFVFVFAAFVAAVFFLARGKHVGVEFAKSEKSEELKPRGKPPRKPRP